MNNRDYFHNVREQFGVVVTFPESMTLGDANYLASKIQELAEGIEVSPVSKFNPEHSSPVFYCP